MRKLGHIAASSSHLLLTPMPFTYKTNKHDLEDIMKNYSVVMSFTGSRFYATIVEPDATFADLFPQDYHVSK